MERLSRRRCVFQVNVVEAEGLKCGKDKAYAKVQLGALSRKTQHSQRTARPFWDAQLEFVDDGHSPHVAIKVYTAYMLVRTCNAPLADSWREAPCILIHRRFLRRASTRASLRSRFCPTAQRSARSQMPGTRCSCTSP